MNIVRVVVSFDRLGVESKESIEKKIRSRLSDSENHFEIIFEPKKTEKRTAQKAPVGSLREFVRES